MIRWLKFNAVGLMGVAVQLAVLAVLVRLGVNYLAATALAVEAALLHNFAWHARWTWKERPGSLWRFHLSNGVLSVCGNVILMRVFTGWLGVPVLAANLAAITSLSLLNFWMGEKWVFSPQRAARRLERAAQ